MIRTEVNHNIFIAKASGIVTRGDYVNTLVPNYEKYLGEVKEQRRFLFEMDRDFKFYDPQALIEDAKLALRHFKDFGKIAVLSDVGNIRGFAHLAKALFPNRVKVFLTRETKAASDWLKKE